LNELKPPLIDVTPFFEKKPKKRPSTKQIAVTPAIHETLKDLKVHPRESFNDVVERLLKKLGVIQ
jgi:hypothetical protein